MRRDVVGVERDEHRAGVVDVWLVEPASEVHRRYLALLDDVERARAARLPSAQSARFVQARALLRTVVGHRLRLRPADVPLEAGCATCGGPHGPVTLVLPGATPPWQVGLTRSGPLLGVALSSAGSVGLDVESEDAVAAASLAPVALSAAELTRHQGLTAPERARHLTRTWARKEAALKALGVGLRRDPATLELTGDGTAVLGRTDVVVTDLDVGTGRAGAVALVLPPSAVAEPAPPTVHLHDGAAALG